MNWACSGSARVPRLTHGVKRRNESYFTRSGRGSLPNVSPAVDNVYGAQRVRGRVPRTAPGPDRTAGQSRRRATAQRVSS